MKRAELRCPQCGSAKVWRDGLRYYNGSPGSVQRWLCRSCGYRFSQPNVKVNVFREVPEAFKPGNDVGNFRVGASDFAFQEKPYGPSLSSCEDVGSRGPSPSFTRVAKSLKVFPSSDNSRRVCASEGQAKNLAATEQWGRQAAGATEQTTKHLATHQAEISKILEYAWVLKKQGYAETTIEGRIKILKRLQKLGADLYNPESVKEAIVKNNCSEARKELMVETYSNFLTFLGGKWEPPRYRRVERIPFIPTEREIDDFIAGCSNTKRLAAYLQLLKETGMRSGEASKLKWTDIDFENAAVRVTPEKGSSPRILKVSNKLVAMLNALPKDSTTIFPNVTVMRKSFVRQRVRLAIKLQNPRLKQITFHTFRHWKATMEYAKTRDILHVMRLLGHKNIKNTLIYTQLVDFKDDEFICKAVITSKEAEQLIEAGFEYVCTATDGVMLFRKRK